MENVLPGASEYTIYIMLNMNIIHIIHDAWHQVYYTWTIATENEIIILSIIIINSISV